MIVWCMSWQIGWLIIELRSINSCRLKKSQFKFNISTKCNMECRNTDVRFFSVIVIEQIRKWEEFFIFVKSQERCDRSMLCRHVAKSKNIFELVSEHCNSTNWFIDKTNIISDYSAMQSDNNAWWCHQIGTFSALLAICVWNSPVSSEFPSQRPVTWSFDVFYLRLNKPLSKQSWGWWFETLSRPSWRHCDGMERIVSLRLHLQ